MATMTKDRITITVHVMSYTRKMGKFRRQIILNYDEAIGTEDATHILRRHSVPDLETMIAVAVRDYFAKNPDLKE